MDKHLFLKKIEVCRNMDPYGPMQFGWDEASELRTKFDSKLADLMQGTIDAKKALIDYVKARG
jgi:hypothetical protein